MASAPGAAAAPAAAAPAAAADSRQLLVPAPPPGVQHVCVEYPGYVGSEARVLETLGGADGVARQLQENPRQLALRLRPADRNCHPAVGAREPSRRLLLKLTRPAAGTSGSDDGGGGGGAWSAEVVASLPHSYRFSSPADYAYVAHDSRPPEEQGLDQQQAVNPPGFQPQPLLCAPPLFAKQPLFDYAFRGFMGAPAAGGLGGAAAAGGAGGRKKGGTSVMASFFDIDVPAPLPEAQLAGVARAHPDTLRLLRSLLQQRPVWPPAALHEAVAQAGGGASGSGRSPVDDLLPRLCYKFRNGPWKNAWTRRGFDPRAAPAARRWQCIEYHLPSEWYSKIAEHRKAAAAAREAAHEPGGSSGSGGASGAGAAGAAGAAAASLPPLASAYSQLLSFEAVPSTQSCSLQMGLLRDSQVQALLGDAANHSQHCSDVCGWLASAAHDAVKKRVKQRFQAVLSGTPIQDDGGGAGEQQQQQQQQGDGPASMQVDGGSGSGGSGGGAQAAAAAAAAASPMEVDALAQQAQQALRLQPEQQAARQAAQQQGAAPGLLPTGMLASLRDYLHQAAAEEQAAPSPRTEESEEGDEGYQTEEGGGGGATAEEDEDEEEDEEEDEGSPR